jgi:hypothetical protein
MVLSSLFYYHADGHSHSVGHCDGVRHEGYVPGKGGVVFAVLGQTLRADLGAGANARRSMGTGVCGGMLFATFIATIFVPVFFTWFAKRKAGGRDRTE